MATPFVTLTVNSSGERGLLGVAFDPAFAINNFVYVYYTATSPAIHNRVSRFTANGDTAVTGSEVVILDLNNLSSATNHNGGAIHFGPDRKLYIAVGEPALFTVLGRRLTSSARALIPSRVIYRRRRSPGAWIFITTTTLILMSHRPAE